MTMPWGEGGETPKAPDHLLKCKRSGAFGVWKMAEGYARVT
jgi:hypothetical protein